MGHQPSLIFAVMITSQPYIEIVTTEGHSSMLEYAQSNISEAFNSMLRTDYISLPTQRS